MSDVLYKCIAADPPWNEKGAGKCKRGADRHYGLLKTPDIIRVILQDPRFRPDPTGCHLWLWVTNNYLIDGLHVMKALGFRYITKFTWGKCKVLTVPDAKGIRTLYEPQNPGLGQYARGLDEPLLFGVMGRLPSLSRSESTLILAPRGKHSEKPTEAYRRMEAISPGPRLEMFARGSREGWDVTGNEAEGTVE